jgi:hypothetical protein
MTYDKVVVTGCSYVEGQKKSENHFGRVLSRHFDSTYINLGSPGSSNDYSYLRLIKYLNNSWKNEKFIKKNMDCKDDDRLLVVFGVTYFIRLHEWNNIIDNHDTILVGASKNILDFCQKITEFESEEDRQKYLNFYMKYFYNEEFFQNKLEDKLIFLHNYLKNRNGKLIVFNSIDGFEPTQNCLNFFRFVTEENNWKSHCVDKHKNEGWEWNGHPSEYANLDLGKRIINFLEEQYV